MIVSWIIMKDIPHEILGMDLELFNQIDFVEPFGGFTNCLSHHAIC